MVEERSFLFGYLSGRRRAGRGPDRPWVRKRPKMPPGPWRAAAVICFTIGALAAWLLLGDSGATWLRVLAGGAVGFAIGMYVVETVWERRFRARTTPPNSPIGKRR